MSTTTIRLPQDLKLRLARIAESRGSSSHALILDAIAERVEAEEKHRDFRETAEQRFAKVSESGETVSWNEMRSYLRARVTGKAMNRPKSRKIARREDGDD